ncbi:MAG: CBASS cGAMP-activated phospholipase [Candidatus Reddybacter sp.]
MSDSFQVLSLSGGGARGLYTAQVLVELEKRFGGPVASHFDIVCGTSIGGILALGLAAHIPAIRLLDVFDRYLECIFPPFSNKDKKALPIVGISRKDYHQLKAPQYSPEPLRQAVEELFGDQLIGDLKSCVIVPAINYSVGQMRAFKTPHNPMFYQDKDRTLVDVALATSAAPTYFPIHRINGDRFVDGGLAANNPILMGVIEAYRAFDIPLENITGLCIGNMGQGLAANHEKSVDLGYKGWGFGQDIINLAMSTGEKLSFDMARMLLKGRLELIDSDATESQAQLLSLDNGSQAAAEILKAHARNQAGKRVNDPPIITLFEHAANAVPCALHTTMVGNK